MSHPGEPDRFFETWPVGDGTCDSRFILDHVGNVTGQSDYPRSVVNLEQIMDAVSIEDVRICT